MKLLLISSLLPKKEGETIETTSYALADLACEWKKNGAEVDVIRPLWNPAETLNSQSYSFHYREVRIEVIPVIRIPKLFRYRTESLLKRIQSMEKTPDLIIAHMTHGIRVAAILSEKLGIPFLAGIHGGDIRLMSSKPGFLIPSLKKARAIWARSPVIRSMLEDQEEISGIRKGLCLSGLAEEEFIDENTAAEKWKGLSREKVKFISAGNLIPLKNFDKVILGMSKMRDLDFSYDIYGQGDEKENLERLIEENGLSEKVDLKGERPRDEVLDAMVKSHFHVMPSKGETFGLTYLEAASKGCINIGLRKNGLDGFFEDGSSAIMLEEPIDRSFANSIKRLIDDPAEVYALFQASLNKVRELNSTSLAKSQIGFFNQLIS